MAQDDRFDLARLERLERRLQALEDAEAIRNLEARYAALCDAQYDADGIAMLFTEDALGSIRETGDQALLIPTRSSKGASPAPWAKAEAIKN